MGMHIWWFYLFVVSDIIIRSCLCPSTQTHLVCMYVCHKISHNVAMNRYGFYVLPDTGKSSLGGRSHYTYQDRSLAQASLSILENCHNILSAVVLMNGSKCNIRIRPHYMIQKSRTDRWNWSSTVFGIDRYVIINKWSWFIKIMSLILAISAEKLVSILSPLELGDTYIHTYIYIYTYI